MTPSKNNGRFSKPSTGKPGKLSINKCKGFGRFIFIKKKTSLRSNKKTGGGKKKINCSRVFLEGCPEIWLSHRQKTILASYATPPGNVGQNSTPGGRKIWGLTLSLPILFETSKFGHFLFLMENHLNNWHGLRIFFLMGNILKTGWNDSNIVLKKVYINIIWGAPQPRTPVTTRMTWTIFHTELNLPLPLESWEGEHPKV